MISIIDYGMGNLRSVQKALEYIGFSAVITSSADEISKSSAVILPGVGAFPDAMENIKGRRIDKVLEDGVRDGKPLLGICLGMQLLFDESEEVRKTAGLGFLKGSIKKMSGNIKIPHMGWNNLEIKKQCSILRGVPENTYAYFVHSYYAEADEEDIVNATAFYGKDVPAVVSRYNVFGLQFHPEKSGEAGMTMLKNFGELVK